MVRITAQSMKTSSYFESKFYHEQSAATGELFTARSNSLFEESRQVLSIIVHEQLAVDQNSVYKLDPSNYDLKIDSESDAESSSVLPPSSSGKCSDRDGDPPGYNGAPRLRQMKVEDSEQLRIIAKVRRILMVLITMLTSAKESENRFRIWLVFF